MGNRNRHTAHHYRSALHVFACYMRCVFYGMQPRQVRHDLQRRCKTSKQKSPNFLNTPDLCSRVRNVGEKNARSIVLHVHAAVGSRWCVWASAFMVVVYVFVGSLFFWPSRIRHFAMVCVWLKLLPLTHVLSQPLHLWVCLCGVVAA